MSNTSSTPEKSSGINVATIVVAIVTVVVVIALLVTTFVVLNNKIKDKDPGVTSEELEEAIGNIQHPDGGLTEAEVKALIEAAIAGIKIPETGLSEEEVKAIVEAALAGIKTGLTEEEVKALIDAAIKDALDNLEIPVSGLTKKEIQKLIDEAIKDLDISGDGLSEAEIKAIIEAALAGIETGLSKEEIQALIDAAIKEALGNLDIPDAGLSKEEIQALINAAIAGADTGLSEEEVRALIAAAIAGIETGLSEEEIQALIDAALANWNPEEPEEPEDPDEELTLEESLALGVDYTLKTNEILNNSVVVPFGKDMTLDLNGYELEVDSFAFINVAGILRIVDSCGGGSVKKDSISPAFGDISGELSINNAEYNDCESYLNTLVADDNIYLAKCKFNNKMILDKNDGIVEIELIDGVSLSSVDPLVAPEGIKVVIDLGSEILTLTTKAIVAEGDVEIVGRGTIDGIANRPFDVKDNGSLSISDARILAYEDLLSYFFSTTSDVTLTDCTLEYDGFGTQKMEIERVAGETNVIYSQNATFGTKFVIPAENVVNIDLGGNSLVMEVTAGFSVSGALYIGDGNNLWARSNACDTFAVAEGGSLTIEDITIQSETSNSKYVIVNNGGDVVLTGCTIEVYTSIPGITITKVVINNKSGDCALYLVKFVEMDNKDDTTPVEVSHEAYVLGTVVVND